MSLRILNYSLTMFWVTTLVSSCTKLSTNDFSSTEPTETIKPTVTINQATGQTDPDTTLPVNFTVTFSEEIDSSSFTTSDVIQKGTASGITWSISYVSSKIFTLSATAVKIDGTLVPTIAADSVRDLAANGNIASTSTDNSVTYNDNTNPTVSSFSPADNSTGISSTANLVITFNEAVDVESGNIVIYRTSDNGVFETIPVTDARVTGTGTNTITINPSGTFASLTGYYVQIAATAFDDGSGNSYAGIANNSTWNFTVADTVAPTVNSFSPADNATGITETSNLVITFSEAVDVETGNIVIYRTSDNAVFETIPVTDARVTGTGTDTITINPSGAFASLTGYYIQIAATAFDDAAGNSYAGVSNSTTWNFTTADTQAPTVQTLSPADNSTGISDTANLVITFSEAVDVESGNIVIYRTSDDGVFETIPVTDARVTGTGTNTITINPSGTFASLTGYYVQIAATAFDDAAGNSYAGISNTTTWNFTIANTSPPTVNSFSPADDAVGVSSTANLVITFSENVTTESGNIVIYQSSNNAVFEVIPVANARVTGSGTNTITINPSKAFASNSAYYVHIASTAFENSLGNSFAGVSNSTTWNFTSASINSILASDNDAAITAENSAAQTKTLTLQVNGTATIPTTGVAGSCVINTSSGDLNNTSCSCNGTNCTITYDTTAYTTGEGKIEYTVTDGTSTSTDTGILFVTVTPATSILAQFASIGDVVNEGNTSATKSITVELNTAHTSDVDIDYEILASRSTASNPSDYDLSNGTVTIPSGQTSATIDYTYHGDAIAAASSTPKISMLSLTQTSDPLVKLDAKNVFRRLVRDDDGGEDNFVTIESVSGHGCSITSTGVLKCWGYNSYGQLGDGTTTTRLTPTTIGSGYSSVSVGMSHTCAITSTGDLQCWGRNNYGQLGDGSTTDRLSPTTIGSNYDRVSASNMHTCAIKTNGDLQCWGENDYGRLGDGTTTDRLTPTTIGANFSKLSAGGLHTCAINTDDDLLCWGYNGQGQIGDGSTTDRLTPITIGANFSKISTGYSHTCAIDTSDDLKCWGQNGNGQLGDGTTTQRTTPTAIGSGYTSVYASPNGYSTCAITTGGALQCWGNNGSGQLGDGTTTQRTSPTNIASGYSSIAVGQNNACGISTGNVLKCWGHNGNGVLGDGTISTQLTPAATALDLNYLSVSVGYNYTCATTSTNTLQCWGRNNFGQLGDGTNNTRSSGVLVGSNFSQVSTSPDISNIGIAHTCAITTTNDLKCWGRNAYGQLGDSTTTDRMIPRIIGSGYAQVSTGAFHTCAITLDDKLQCWGRNNVGQLGDGTTTDSSIPLNIGSDYAAVSAGGSHTCALTNNGDLQCWGVNSNGQLGDGSTTNRSTLTYIGSNYASVSSGSNHTCAITTTGDLYCWGRNSDRQLGDGTTTQRTSPTLIGTSYSSASAGYQHTCAINNDDDLLCWGYNWLGRLGDGTTTNRSSPTAIGTNYTSVSTRGTHTCAIDNTGNLACWGSAEYGKLGDGAQSMYYLPIPIW